MRRRSMRRTLLGGGAALLLLLAACGGDGGGEDVDAGSTPERAPAGDSTWEKQELTLENGAESEPQLLTDGADAVIVTGSEEGVVAGHASAGGGPFEAGAPVATGVAPLWFGAGARMDENWFVLGNGGTKQVDGDDQLTMDPVVMRSTDGRDWVTVDATGFSGPLEFQDAVAVDGAIVAVGARRDANDPGSGVFVATAWRSADGTTWEETRLPGADSTSFTTDVVAAGDRLIAVGGTGDQEPAVWESDDGGRTWQEGALDGIPSDATVQYLTGEGDVLVASGTRPSGSTDPDEEDERSHLISRSSDGGVTWEPAGAPPPAEGESYGFPVEGRSGRFFTITSSFTEGWRDPERCYADIEQCRQDNAVVLYTSDDGDTWERVDTSGFGTGEEGEVDTIDTLDDGTVIALRAGETSWTVGTWPGGTDLPVAAEPTEASADVVMLAEGEEPEIGVRYAAPLHIHCGMDWLYLGEEPWQRTDDGPDVETGAGESATADWPVAQQAIYGFATLVDEETVEYSIGDGEVIATYGPPKTDPVPCM